MENSSKALLMAAGILVFILIVSVLMYVYQQVSEIPRTQEQMKEAEELAAFNKQYEAYERNNLKGTDVMTVMYKADDNNKTYENETQYHITIEMQIKNTLDQTVRKYILDTNNKWSLDKTATSYEGSSYNAGWYCNPTGNTKKATRILLKTDSIYQGGTSYNKAESEYSTNKSVWKSSFDQIEEAVMQMSNPTYYERNNATRELMRRKFKCTEVDYSNETGRINYMAFEEQ